MPLLRQKKAKKKTTKRATKKAAKKKVVRNSPRRRATDGELEKALDRAFDLHSAYIARIYDPEDGFDQVRAEANEEGFEKGFRMGFQAAKK